MGSTVFPNYIYLPTVLVRKFLLSAEFGFIHVLNTHLLLCNNNAITRRFGPSLRQ